MRLNKYIASSTGLSRRSADDAILRNRVLVNGQPPSAGQQVTNLDQVMLDHTRLNLPAKTLTIMLNKPAGYICSREGQGNPTIYELLPPELVILKPVGRLDKDSSGLLLMTSDGDLAQRLTHPKYQKTKIYAVQLDKPLAPLHRQMISDHGLQLEDGVSRLQLQRLHDDDELGWQVAMQEGRNRQIRRTFEALGYHVRRLNRTQFGAYRLDKLAIGSFINLED